MVSTVRKWNSLSEFVDYTEGPCDLADAARHSRFSTESFSGTRDMAHAEELAFNWREGVERINKVRARIALANQRNRKRAVSREVGPGVLSMGHYLSGHPQPYVCLEDDDRQAKGKGKVVRILVNIQASAMVDTETIERRGAAMLAAIDALEQSGRRVELTLVAAIVGKRGGRSEYYVTLKKAQQKLNLNSVAFAVAHPSMLRRFVFAAQEREDQAYRNRFGISLTGGYGRPTNVESDHADIYLGRMFGSEVEFHSDKAASDWVAQTLEAQGVKIK